jgi:hypothetical protein
VLTDDVRRHCAAVAATARHVRIDQDAEIDPGGVGGLDPQLHFLEGEPADVTRYMLILDAINFGSGWFGELATDTDSITARLTAHARAERPWTADELHEIDARAVGDVLAMPPEHRLTQLYAQALNQLGAFLPALGALGDSADAFAERLTAMPFFADRGFYKRAQIAAHDLHLAGVAEFADVHRLTVFADNLLPHVLRLDGVLHYSDALAARIDAGVELPAGSDEESELRACTVHACERLAQRLGVMPATLDNWLWNRGQTAPYSDRPAHVTRSVYY